MSTQSKPHSKDELIAFLEKLAKFHETLSPSEKAILDQMTAAALSASPGDVQAFAYLPTLGEAFRSPQLVAHPYYRSVTTLTGYK